VHAPGRAGGNVPGMSVEYENQGRFPFTKNFGNFPLGISVREERVPFVTSSIPGEGAEKGPAA